MDVKQRLEALRSLMRSRGIDMYLVESEDFHGSEYVSEYFQCRAYISGFTGSAGTAVITQDWAGLWTDGRYFLQADRQLEGSGFTLCRMGEEGVPTVREYILSHIKAGQTLGFDGRTVNAGTGKMYQAELEKRGAFMNAGCDLVGEIWKERPALSHHAAWLMDEEKAGESRVSRIRKVRAAMEEKGADHLLLTSLDDIAWLLNIRGGDVKYNPVVMSYVMVSGSQLLLFAGKNQFSPMDRERLLADGVRLCAYEDFYDEIGKISPDSTVMLDENVANYAAIGRLAEGVKVIDAENPTLMLKAVKNPVEMENIRQAHIKDGIALTRFMYWLKKHGLDQKLTEIGASDKMESFRKQQPGYLEPSFAPISAYGEHAAIVHYSATPETDAVIEPKGLLLMDTGGQYMQGTTDITRTFVMGPLKEDEKIFFTLVLKGHLNLAGAKFRHGCSGINLDYLAREPLWQIGMDYNHGTGHGVGYLLNVHEGPNSIRWRTLPMRSSNCVLEEGMLTSDEPGVYITGRFGIRHESLMMCRKAEKTAYGQFMQFDTLTMVPFDLDGVEPSLMTEREKKLLNEYHRKVYETVGPQLPEEEREWLAYATREI